MEESALPVPQFDFQEHERVAVAEYLKRQSHYADLASVISRIVEECLKKREIKIHSVQHRAKDANSLGRKATIPSELDPNRPKYDRPLEQITDLAGVKNYNTGFRHAFPDKRIITFRIRDIGAI
jgi:putative GTP pyrophosphokinase